MIKIVLLDIDGVLTDGKVMVDANGNEFKTIDYKDIDAVFEMKRQGLKVGLLTGEATPITLFFKNRFKPDFFYNGCKDKTAALYEILALTGALRDEVCYVGDSLHDVPVLKVVTFAACPANAVSEVKHRSNIHLRQNGGDGCIWELLKWLMDHNQHEPDEAVTV